MFEDQEQEQVYANFIIQQPYVHSFYMGLSQRYNHCQEVKDQQMEQQVGTEIFNLIMPFA